MLKMSLANIESASSTLETILTMKTSEDYSSEFDPATEHNADYTEEYHKSTKTSDHDGMYSDDFEDSVPSRPTSSVRFSEDLEFITAAPLSGMGYSYSEDFESEEDGPSNRPFSTIRESESYSEDFESGSTKTPRTSAGDHFDSVDCNSQQPQFQYSETFDSVTESSHSSDSFEDSSRESVQSVLLSHRKRRDSSREEKSLSYITQRTTSYDSDTETLYSGRTNISEDTERMEATHVAKESFILQKLELLKKEVKPHKRVRAKSSRSNLEKPTVAEKNQLHKFCQEKIDVLKSPEKQKAGKVGNAAGYQSYREAITGISQAADVSKFGITSQVVDNIKLENTLCKINKMANMEIHEPKTCRHCIKKYEKLAEKEFFTSKYAVVSEKNIQDKLEREHIRCNDPTILMGEILKDLPRLSDNPKEIYQKLMKPLSERPHFKSHLDCPQDIEATRVNSDTLH